VFRFDDVLRKMRLNVTNSEGEVFSMSERFKDLFCFENVGPYPNGVCTAENTFNVNDISHLLYVYATLHLSHLWVTSNRAIESMHC